MTEFILIAQGNNPGTYKPPGFLDMMFPIILMCVIMYFIAVKPQQRKQKQHQEMIQTLKSGDRIVTSGGIYGTIAGVKEDTFLLKIADNVKIEVTKSSIAEVIKDEKQGC